MFSKKKDSGKAARGVPYKMARREALLRRQNEALAPPDLCSFLQEISQKMEGAIMLTVRMIKLNA